MRIQHNILAMNAYRNYSNNTSALGKNLERLSSGYKINRAGDDAAGLAISEKMRAQITGLNAAQKNVKDGISLVKTAEGAMQEIQDMLNRMDYLATQSANGTYDDSVDREALQKEVDQLKSEIDRIADSSNFNGIKLLDGSRDGSGATLAAARAAATAAARKVADMQAALDTANNMQVAGVEDSLGIEDIKNLFADEGTVASANAGNQVTIYETEATEMDEPGFAIDFDGVEYTMAGDGASTSNATSKDGFTVNISDGTSSFAVTITEEDIAKYDSTATTGSKISGKTLAAIIAEKINSDASFAGSINLDKGAASADNNYKVRVEGTKVMFTATNNLDENKNRHYSISIKTTSAIDALGKQDAKQGVFTSKAVTTGAGNTTNVLNKGDIVKTKISFQYYDKETNQMKSVDNLEISTTLTKDGMTYKDIMKALAAEMNKNETFGKYFRADYDSTNDVFTYTSQTGGVAAKDGDDGAAQITKVGDINITIKATGSTLTALTFDGSATDGKNLDESATVDGEAAYTPGFGNTYVNAGAEVTVQVGESGDATLASTVMDIKKFLKDGTSIQLGDQVYRLAFGENSAYRPDSADGKKYGSETSIWLKDLDPNADYSNDDVTLKRIMSALVEAAKDNKTFEVGHTADGKLALKQLASAKEDTDMTDATHLAGYIHIKHITAEGNESIKDAAIAEAQQKLTDALAKQKAADERVTTVQNNPGKSLQLQIGDTSDSYNQMMINIGDMHVTALGIGDLNIGTAEDAAESIQTIRDAINNVSSVRGDLGAYQNRLEHTQNNLSVMAENIQDAESTIRDTDVAEEMMSYVKNNILVQSAQAMLAQANQVPQGVLQLLG